MWNKDEIKGKGKKFKGRVKEKAGELIGDREIEAKGEAERGEGQALESHGQARRKAEEFKENLEDTLEEEHD